MPLLILTRILGYLASPIIRMAVIAALGAGGVGIVYLKGRSDATSNMERKALIEQQAAVEKSIKIRRSSRLPASDRGLYDNDGYRRD